MSNMSYCRFQNTLRDLRDCYENIDDENLSEEEQSAKEDLILYCYLILKEWREE